MENAHTPADLHGRPVVPMAVRAAPERVVLDVIGHRGRHGATPGGGRAGNEIGYWLATGSGSVAVILAVRSVRCPVQGTSAGIFTGRVLREAPLSGHAV